MRGARRVIRPALCVQAAKPHSAGLKVLQNVELLMPALWNAEVANALELAERCGAATPAKVGSALTAISALNPSVDSQTVEVNRNLEIARGYGLSAYDALYFELTLRRKAALATFEDVMISAVPSAGIRLYPPPAIAPAKRRKNP